MAAAVAASTLPITLGRLVSACSRSILRPSGPGAASLWSAPQRSRSQSTSLPQGGREEGERADRHRPVRPAVCRGALCQPPVEGDPRGPDFNQQRIRHCVWGEDPVGEGRLSHSLLLETLPCVTSQVLLVGADTFTLLGKPLLGKDLVRVEATVIEKTESWPKVNMKFKKRENYRKKKIIVNPQTVLRINTIEIAPCLC